MQVIPLGNSGCPLANELGTKVVSKEKKKTLQLFEDYTFPYPSSHVFNSWNLSHNMPAAAPAFHYLLVHARMSWD